MTTTFKKGDIVWLARGWGMHQPEIDKPASIMLQRCRVESWGAQQGTLSILADRQMAGFHLNTKGLIGRTWRIKPTPIPLEAIGRTDHEALMQILESWAWYCADILRRSIENDRAWLRDYQHRAEPEVVAKAQERLHLSEKYQANLPPIRILTEDVECPV